MNTTVPDYMPTLAKGAHDPGSGKACVMEYVSVLAGEHWTDHPACTHSTIASIARALNDALYNEQRQLLIPLIPRLLTANVKGTGVTTKQVTAGMAKFMAAYRAPWMKHGANEAIRKTFGSWMCACCNTSLHSLGTEALVVALLTSTPKPEDQIRLLTDLLDEFDRLVGRTEPVPDIEPERMTRAVCFVEGKPVPVQMSGFRAAVKAATQKMNLFGAKAIEAAHPVATFTTTYEEKPVSGFSEEEFVKVLAHTASM